MCTSLIFSSSLSLLIRDVPIVGLTNVSKRLFVGWLHAPYLFLLLFHHLMVVLPLFFFDSSPFKFHHWRCFYYGCLFPRN